MKDHLDYQEARDLAFAMVEKLEPAVQPFGISDIQRSALVSCAISLKRIADQLAGANLDETVRTAVYNGTYDALHQHWRDKH